MWVRPFWLCNARENIAYVLGEMLWLDINERQETGDEKLEIVVRKLEV